MKPGFSFRGLAVVVGGMALSHAAALLALVLTIVTLGRARRFCTDVIIRRTSALILAIGGLRVVVHQQEPFPTRQTVYVFNHTSSLDLLVVCALGLPNVRFFMKKRFALLPALGVLGAVAGVFFTPPQTDRGARVRCFRSAADTLKRTGESVFLSPEGTRVTSGDIGAFNKGAFHLAADLSAPIVPLYFQIPKASDPGKGILVRPGDIHVHVLPSIATSAWSIERVDEHKAGVRGAFVEVHERLRAA